MRKVGEKIGVLIGTTTSGLEEYKKSAYMQAVTQHFAAQFSTGNFSAANFEQYGVEGMRQAGKVFIDAADQSGQVLQIHPGFWPVDIPARIRNASNDDVLAYMQQRTKDLLSFVRLVDTGAKPTHINYFNEAFMGVGLPKWSDNAYFHVFGENILSETYLMFYRAGLDMGLTPGKVSGSSTAMGTLISCR